MIESHSRARRLFDETAADYQERSEARVSNFSSLVFQRRIHIVQDLLRRARPGTVLDYGMGPAVFGPACTASGWRYVGIDISPEMVERGRALNLPNAEFHVGDLDVLRSYRQRADAVLAIGLLDYLEEPTRGLQALASCVKPGGSLILSFRNRVSVPRILRDAAKRLWRALAPKPASSERRAFFADVHERSFDFQGQLRPELEALGFEECEARYFNCSPIFFNFPLPRRLWSGWYALDSALAGAATRWMCSGGVLMARRRNA